MHTLIAPLINFAFLIGLFIYFLKGPIRGFVMGRHTALRDDLERVQIQLREAQMKFQEYTAKLQAIDGEVQLLTSQVKAEAEATQVRILTEAKKMSDTIIIDAKKNGETLMNDMKADLRATLASQVLSRAEAMIRTRLTGDDRERIKKDFSQQVGKSS